MFRYEEGQIEIPDIEIEAFKAMLTFIYTKHFNGLDANNLQQNIIGLVKKCADFPIEKLPNVFGAFQEARFLNVEALRWADEQCLQNGIECSAENRREMLGPALFKIRFPLIPKEDFTKGVVSIDVLTTEEVDSIYQHYCHSDVPALFPLKFPTQQRYKYEDTIGMEIEKVSEFALEEELLDPSKGFYNKDEDKVKLAIDVIVTSQKRINLFPIRTNPTTHFRWKLKIYRNLHEKSQRVNV
ncbi:hypothetical protein niasHT_012791 [Heterodera trifolii]|uniref:BTB domain-containing protein n=1 Tax=Heterodera trifolii TaxID=157864 RepID=A0ABD2L8Y1_9BILA